MSQAPAHEPWYNKTWLVILLCLFFFPVGLYALWKSGKLGIGWKVGITVIVGLLVVAAFTDPKTATAAENKKKEVKTGTAAAETSDNEEKKEEEPASKDDRLPMWNEPEDFKTAFNSASAITKLDYEIEEVKVSDGEVQNSFSAAITKNIGFIGSVDKKTGKVLDVLMIGTGDGSFQSGTDIMLTMATLIATVDPELPPTQRGEILKELGLLTEGKDIFALEEKTDRNGFHYSLTSSKLTGFMFAISKKK